MKRFINREEAKFIIDNWIIFEELDILSINTAKNKEVIEAFAKGEEIEYRNVVDNWKAAILKTIDIESYDYRIKKSKSKEEEFFEQVKGKKIRQKKWLHNNFYFIPKSISNIYMTGNYSAAESILNYEPVLNGFKDWEFYKEPEYIPFTFEDGPKLIGRVIRHKLDKSLKVIDSIECYWNHNVYNSWFEDYELLTIENDVVTKVEPCGKIKEDKK